MKKFSPVLLVALFCGVAQAQNPPTSPNAADKVELKVRWQAGKRYLMKLMSEQKISQTMDGKPIVIDQTLGFNYVYAVQNVDAAGVAKVETEFRDVLFKIVAPGEKAPTVIEYDSTKPKKEIPPAMSGIASLVGQKVWMKIAPDGQTREAGGFKEVIAHMIKSISVPPGAERTIMENSLKSQFSEESFKEMLAQGMNKTYPAHPVAVGDSWKSDVKMTQSLPMQLVSTFTLKERKDGLSIIGLESTLALDSKGKPMQAANSKIAMQLQGKQSGTMQIRESDGWIMKSQAKLDFSGTVSVSTTPSGPGDISRPTNKSWPISIVGTTTVDSEDL